MSVKVVILSLAALLCTVQGTANSRISPNLWSQLVQMMQVEATEKGICDGRCFVDVPGREIILLKPGQTRIVMFDDGTCVDYYCTEYEVTVINDFSCPPPVCNDNQEILHHPNRCCPVCEGTFDDLECTVANWGEWGQCSRTCGGGRRVRVREITFPESPDTVFCNETLTEIGDCNTEGCPVDCAFEWGRFGECSQTCDGGFRVRFPIVSEEPQNGGQPCPPAQQEDCGTTPCPQDCIWEWAPYGPCSATCNRGIQTRRAGIIRPAANGGRPCPAPEVRECGTVRCPVDCVFEWGPFGPCSRTCDGGSQRRQAGIIRPASNGGRPCPAPEVRVCGTIPCPVDCLFEWAPYGPCSRTCDGGTQTRQVGIIRPAANGGQECPGPETRECGTIPCPEDCIWKWGPFGECSVTCDGGTRIRQAKIIRQARYNGRPCPPYLLDGVPQTVPGSEECGLIPCPTVCTLTECTINGVTRCIDPEDDRDKDCVPDTQDNCEDIFNPDQKDIDKDGTGDVCDDCNLTPKSGPVDQDGDGVEDACDNCPKTRNSEQLNHDDDETGDECDDDDDNDGIQDDGDNCQFVKNPYQINDDNDGPDQFGDACDNCPQKKNANQFDVDGDGVGNACDNCRFVKNPDQRADDPARFGDQCTKKPPGMAEEYDEYEDKKGLVTEIMERLMEMYYSN